MTSRVVIIGDLQGCYQEAIRLLDKVGVTPTDHVIFTGDLIDRGPDNGLCVDLAMRRESIQGKPACVLGNHEAKHLQYRALDEQGRDAKVVIPSHIATREQLTDEHYEYFKRLPLFIRLPEHGAAVVHAGAYPGIELEDQDPYLLTHIQMIEPQGSPGKTTWPSRAPTGWQFWTHHWNGPERLVFGHSVLNKPLVTPWVVGVDGGVCFGRWLHALVLPEWEIVSVKGARDYGVGKRGRTSNKATLFTVHGDVQTYS
jgi:Calcineurin-like phosphoesterase